MNAFFETTNGFNFQIIDPLIESRGVRLTWFDCNHAAEGQHEQIIDNNKFGKKEKGREVATDVTALTKKRKKNSDKDSNVGTEAESTDCSEI